MINGKQLVYNIVEQLQQDGFNITKADLNNVEFKALDDACGYTCFADIHTYNLVVNEKLLNDDKLNFLKCTVYHELAHIIQYNEAISNNIIKYNKEENVIEIICKDITLADNLVFDNFHHTKFWFDIVSEMNTKYNIIPKVTAYLNNIELDKFLEEFFMDTRKRNNDPLIEPTISGLSIDDMMKYNIKSEYKATSIDESLVSNNIVLTHDYKDLNKYINK